jgi:phage tail-like protein
MTEKHDSEMSRLMDYLPAVYQGLDDTDLTSRDEAYADQPPFLNYFLLAFEKVLLGRKDHFVPKESAESGAIGKKERRFEGLGEEITKLHHLFEPDHTPPRFLAWLAGWAALSLEAGISLERRRKLVASIIPLYRIRGTKAYLEQLLAIHLEAPARVDEQERPHLQVGRHSTVGQDTYLGGSAPHSFRVTLEFPRAEWQGIEAQYRLARRVIDLAKPAHTLYELLVKSHRMQVGVHSTVGVDTILGS